MKIYCPSIKIELASNALASAIMNHRLLLPKSCAEYPRVPVRHSLQSLRPDPYRRHRCWHRRAGRDHGRDPDGGYGCAVAGLSRGVNPLETGACSNSSTIAEQTEEVVANVEHQTWQAGKNISEEETIELSRNSGPHQRLSSDAVFSDQPLTVPAKGKGTIYVRRLVSFGSSEQAEG